MHKISALFLPLLLFYLTGCEGKKPNETGLPIENTIEFVSPDTNKTVHKTSIIANDVPPIATQTPEEIPELISEKNTFILFNTKNKCHKVTLIGEEAIFHNNTKKIVLINLFSTWCTPCIGQLSYFNGLQKKYSHTLLILGVLSHDSINSPSLKSFIARHEINYFISNSPHNNAFGEKLADILHLPENYSIPLSIMYVEGKYFTHYEGIVPVEMIEYDIQQAKKQIKSNKE